MHVNVNDIAAPCSAPCSPSQRAAHQSQVCPPGLLVNHEIPQATRVQKLKASVRCVLIDQHGHAGRGRPNNFPHPNCYWKRADRPVSMTRTLCCHGAVMRVAACTAITCHIQRALQ